MQSKQKCEFCTKSEFLGKNKDGSLRFGCKNSFCIFEAIVDNPYREQLKQKYKELFN